MSHLSLVAFYSLDQTQSRWDEEYINPIQGLPNQGEGSNLAWSDVFECLFMIFLERCTLLMIFSFINRKFQRSLHRFTITPRTVSYGRWAVFDDKAIFGDKAISSKLLAKEFLYKWILPKSRWFEQLLRNVRDHTLSQ